MLFWWSVINQEEKIKRALLEGDALSLLLFILAIMPPNYIIRKCTSGFKLHELQEKITYLMYMYAIELLAKNENDLETLIQEVRIYS